MTPDPCQHLRLKRVKVGEQPFYKCENSDCPKNFHIPEPLTIKVSYPEPRAEDRQ